MMRTLYIICSVLLLQVSLHAQQPPLPPSPIAIFVNPQQGLIFGTFFRGNSGGSVIIYPDGSRSVTGDIIQSNIGVPFSPAIFEMESNLGTVVTILNGPDIILNGSNGGTVSLHLGNSSTGSPFITSVQRPARATIRIGGTLYVGGPLASPSGSYSGNFYITFIQQ
jgi:hypothetical protein